MDDSKIFSLFMPLWSDIRPEDDFSVRKPKLAHYTSVMILEQILKNNEIWLSNPLFMNDLDELRFGINLGVPLVLQSTEISDALGTDQRSKIFNDIFYRYHYQFENDHLMDTYIFCLSEHEHDDGLLSMWRGYGGNGNGAAIVFDTAKLNVVEGSAFILAKVFYATRDERIDWLRRLTLLTAKIIREGEIPDDKLYIVAHLLFERIKAFSLFTKHSGFSEEREWRVVYLKSRDSNNTLEPMFDYALTSRGAEPKLKLKLMPMPGIIGSNFNLAEVIHKIILGPAISTPLAKETIRRMLGRLKMNNLQEKVVPSSIPFRGNTAF